MDRKGPGSESDDFGVSRLARGEAASRPRRSLCIAYFVSSDAVSVVY